MRKKCIFCNINKNNNLNSSIIFQKKGIVVLLVSTPESPGHVVVFPEKHYSELAQMGKYAGTFFENCITLAENLSQYLNANAYIMKLNNKVFMLENDPMHVGHIHMHVIPRYKKKSGKNLEYKSETEILKLSKRLRRLFN